MATVAVYPVVWESRDKTLWRADRWDAEGILTPDGEGELCGKRQDAIDDVAELGDIIEEDEPEYID